jgi:rubrerythrin
MKQETRAHYEKLAEIVIDNDLKRLFALMASAEGEHIDTLIELKDGMNTHDLRDEDKLQGSVCVYSSHVDPQHLAEALRNDPDAYRHVVKEEVEAIEFFDQMSDQADSKELKRICHLLADKEREHLAKLENIYFFVEEPRTYLEWGEFSNLKSL